MADLIVVAGDTLARHVQRLGVSRPVLRIVPPGLDEMYLKRTGQPPVFHGGFGGRCLLVGRFDRVKGIDGLVRAVALLRGAGIKAVIAGHAPYPRYYKYISRLIDDLGVGGDIETVGRISDTTKLLALYDRSDIAVIPSLWETYPIIALEAMSAGLPIVATNVGGLPELVTNGRNGLLVPVGNSEDLATAIHRLASNYDLRVAMGEAAQESCRGTARSWQVVAADFYATLTDYLGRRRHLG